MSPGIKSFGYSLSAGLDMDSNGYSGEVIELQKLNTLPNSYYHFTHLLAVGIIAKSVVFSSIQMAQKQYLLLLFIQSTSPFLFGQNHKHNSP